MESKKEFGSKQDFEKQTNLPSPILKMIFSQLDFEDIPNCSLCCKQFFFLIKEDEFWRVFGEEKYGKLDGTGKTWQEKVKKMKERLGCDYCSCQDFSWNGDWGVGSSSYEFQTCNCGHGFTSHNGKFERDKHQERRRRLLSQEKKREAAVNIN